MALAIELAAGRVEAYGLQQTAALLDERFALLWPGQRTAPARQKTLQATFDWSYRLLSDTERAVFRGLAVFVGPFRIDAALAVVTSETVDAPRMFAAIDSLVAKSLVAAVPAGATMRYRLLDAARAYALEITTDRAERRALAARHVAHCLRWLEGFATNPPGLLDATRRLSNLVELNNVRAALTWCFGDDGDVTSGVELVTAAAPVFFAMSLLTECQHWSQRAIAALDDATLGGRREMRLQAALALSLMWTRGNSEATLAALNRSIAIARMRDDPLNQIMLLAPLHVFHMRTAEFRTAMHYARDVCALSRTTEDRSSIELSRILLGYSCHFAGDLAAARSELEAALRHSPAEARRLDRQTPATMMDDAMAAPILALAWAAAPSALARTLWLQGQPAAALEQVHRTLADTADANHPVAMVVAVMYAISVLIWNGDFDAAADQIAGFVAVAKSSDLPSHILLGRCFEAQLAISRGETQRGVDLLQISLRDLRALRYEILTTSFNLALVEAFVALGRLDEAQGLIETAIESTRTNGDLCYLPELLRVKALVLDALPQPQDDVAEACLEQALVLSRDQGALAWELRGTIDRARRLAMQGQTDLARTSLASVVDCFAAESDTADLRTARDLLATLARKLLRNSPKGDFVPPTTPPP